MECRNRQALEQFFKTMVESSTSTLIQRRTRDEIQWPAPGVFSIDCSSLGEANRQTCFSTNGKSNGSPGPTPRQPHLSQAAGPSSHSGQYKVVHSTPATQKNGG